jgi:hypothetical protein
MLGVRAVGEVDAGHVESGVHEPTNGVGSRGGRT